MATTGSDGWKWGGCSDNLVFGEQISKKVLDTGKHDSQARRVALRKAMRTLCKCHGVSGSCVTQNYWKQFGDFKKYLKKQYKRTAKVDLSNGILKKLESHRSNSMNTKKKQQDDKP